jgi:hypothetical protein
MLYLIAIEKMRNVIKKRSTIYYYKMLWYYWLYRNPKQLALYC